MLASIVVRLTLASGRQPLAWLSYTAAGLTAAALTWLAVAWTSLDILKLAATATARMLAATGFVVATGVVYAASTRSAAADLAQMLLLHEGRFTANGSAASSPARRSIHSGQP